MLTSYGFCAMELRSSVDFTDDEWQSVWEAIWSRWQVIRNNPKGWLKHVSIQDAYQAVRKLEVHAVLTEGYLIAYEVDAPWWNRRKRMLLELMVVGVKPTAPFSHVPKVLEQLGRMYKCDLLCAGDALTIDPRVGRTYERAGWRDEASQYFKEL